MFHFNDLDFKKSLDYSVFLSVYTKPWTFQWPLLICIHEHSLQ